MAAAIVASLIGAIAVVIGVWLSQHLSRSAQLGRELVQRVASIQDLQLSLVSLTDGFKTPIDDQWVARSTRLTAELGELQAFATGLRKRQRDAVSRAAAEFNIKWMAGLMRFQIAHHLRIEEILVLFEVMRNLNKVAGRGLEQDDQFIAQLSWYAENGLDAPFPEA